MPVIRTLVVDDDPDMRRVAAMTLSTDPRVDVVGVAADGVEAVALWRQLRPDAIVLDMRMPGMSGLDVAREVLTDDRAVTVVIWSASLEAREVREASRLGVAAVLDKLELVRLADVLAARGA